MVWRMVGNQTVDEDRRQRHRELIDLKAQRTKHSKRIKECWAVWSWALFVNTKLPERKRPADHILIGRYARTANRSGSALPGGIGSGGSIQVDRRTGVDIMVDGAKMGSLVIEETAIRAIER